MSLLGYSPYRAAKNQTGLKQPGLHSTHGPLNSAEGSTAQPQEAPASEGILTYETQEATSACLRSKRGGSRDRPGAKNTGCLQRSRQTANEATDQECVSQEILYPARSLRAFFFLKSL